MDWEECKDKKIVKSIGIDISLVESLVKSSEKKMQSQELLPLNSTTASSKLSLAYDSLREFLEAIAIHHGFKVYNHECYCAFLKEILGKSSLGDEFDKIRKVRNSVNYYGTDIEESESRDLINKIKNLLVSLKEFIK
jgi:hypothetical protein